MKNEYYLSTFKSRPNPYAKRLKKPVMLRISQDVLDYFQKMAEETGVPYKTLINLYLRECATTHKKLKFAWVADGKAAGS